MTFAPARALREQKKEDARNDKHKIEERSILSRWVGCRASEGKPGDLVSTPPILKAPYFA